MEPRDYQAWLSGGAPGGLAGVERAEAVPAISACNTCHRTDAQGRGPVLEACSAGRVALQTARPSIADEGYIRESILEPQAKMVAGLPADHADFQGQVSEEGSCS